MAPVAWEMRIQVLTTGAVDITAPFDNPMLCYGMLETARAKVDEEAKALRDRLIVPAKQMPDKLTLAE